MVERRGQGPRQGRGKSKKKKKGKRRGLLRWSSKNFQKHKKVVSRKKGLIYFLYLELNGYLLRSKFSLTDNFLEHLTRCSWSELVLWLNLVSTELPTAPCLLTTRQWGGESETKLRKLMVWDKDKFIVQVKQKEELIS